MKDKTSLFPCYSVPFRDFLFSKGIRYELVGLNPNTKKMFWVYLRTTELDNYAQEWSLKK